MVDHNRQSISRAIILSVACIKSKDNARSDGAKLQFLIISGVEATLRERRTFDGVDLMVAN
jgi:hypothetical protein